jgi:hypothetical protein
LESSETLVLSLDMNICDYDLFWKVKEQLYGVRSRMRGGIVSVLVNAVSDISRRGTADGVKHLPQVWQHVCNVRGDFMVCEVPTLNTNFSTFGTVLSLIFKTALYKF